MKKKPFLITIDTEGDNLWNYKLGDRIETNNSLFLPRFQLLCNKHSFKPTYLVNYEMAASDNFVEFAKKEMSSHNCEIGMHLHAWNCLPTINLTKRNDGVEPGLPYITEYDEDSIEKKVEFMTNFIFERFGVKPISHRAGRWASNNIYAKILEKYGYKIDCTFTPRLSWEGNPGYTNNFFGNNYSKITNDISFFYDSKIIEIPFQSYLNKRIKRENIHSLKSFIKNVLISFKRKEHIVLRPNGKNLNDLLYIVKKNRKSRQKYLMFMLHSSEFMPGGSPTFDNETKIEKLYEDLNILFEEISKYYFGMTVGEFGESISKHD